MFVASSIIDGMNTNSIPADSWNELYELLVFHHREAKVLFFCHARVCWISRFE